MFTNTEVILVNGQPMVRAGVAHFLRESEFHLIHSFESFEDAMSLIMAKPNALLVLDVMVKNADSRKADRNAFDFLKSTGFSNPFVIFSESDNETHIARAAVNGAKDYIPLGIGKEGFLQRLKCVIACMSHKDNKIVALKERSADLSHPIDPLTKRETQIIRYVALGLSNKEIAQIAEISVETVKEHVQHALRKLGVDDRTKAAMWLIEREKELKKSA